MESSEKGGGLYASHRQEVVHPPGLPGPIASVPRSDGAAVAIVVERTMPSWFRAMGERCLNLEQRLHVVVEDELQGLFGTSERPPISRSI